MNFEMDIVLNNPIIMLISRKEVYIYFCIFDKTISYNHKQTDFIENMRPTNILN